MKKIDKNSISLDAFSLKIIAIIAMTINHIGHVFNFYSWNYPLYVVSLIIGKLTYPIMAYLLVEGFHYTKNVRRYVYRLAIFWLLSIVPFYLAFYYPSPFHILEQFTNNVLFTLLMGLLMMIMIDKTKSKLVEILYVICFSLLTINSDWMIIGVLIVYGFYKIKDLKKKIVVPIHFAVIFNVGLILLIVFLRGLMNTASNIIKLQLLVEALNFLGLYLVVPLLLHYNGKRGYSPKWVSIGFYAYYPLHLLVLFLLSLS